ncbi:MAG: glycosyltransferase family 39 protein [Bdellovibrionales bacterium]|nr:glycosyltransferase family 39 protein [Bdellovibrionales bacterium]
MTTDLKKLFLITLGIKLFAALFIPLTFDEYYYLIWGQNPRLSYFDHPPMTGWLMSIGQLFKNLKIEAIRWPFLALTHGTLYVWYLILKDHLSKKHLYYFFLVALLNPLWGFGVFIATPDIPLLFFWSLSIFYTLKLFEKPTGINYFLLGASLGLGFLSKYQIVLFVPCLLFFVIQKKAYDKVLNPKVLIAIMAGLVFCSPVLAWNYMNEWASFDFQWNHGMKSSHHWKWFWPLEYFLGQLLILFPAFFYIAVKKDDKEYPLSSLIHFIIFPFLFFLYSSFKSHVEGNWAIMIYPTVYALAFVKMPQSSLKWVRHTLTFWGTLFVLCFVIIFSSHLIPGINRLKLFESQKFEASIEYARDKENVLPYNYQMTSYLSHYLGKELCKFPKYGRIDFYNFQEKCQELPEHFFYLLPLDHQPPLEEDFPGFQIVGKDKIDKSFYSIEVRKK